MDLDLIRLAAVPVVTSADFPSCRRPTRKIPSDTRSNGGRMQPRSALSPLGAVDYNQ